MAKVLIGVNQLGTLLSVVIIDVVLAGDNAIVVGMAASGLPIERRRSVICLGIAAATVLRIFFAYFAVQLLAVIGLTLAGGVLLLWVSWKMYREIRETQINDPVATAEAAYCGGRPRTHRTSGTQALHFWISWVGLGIITFVALRMIWDGSTEIIKQTAALTLS